MNYTKEQLDAIIVDSFRELNYKQKLAFLSHNCSDELIKTCGEGVYNKITAQFSDGDYRCAVLENLEKRNIVCVTLGGEGYPARLADTPAPPLCLYLRGNKDLLKGRMFAVVGSRKSLAVALEHCKSISAELSKELTVVTGVAGGADGAATAGALPSGRIVCVLPGGHDSSCAANPTLLKEVEKVGLTVSEFPPLTRAQRFTFFLRNRVIAGMAEGVLVVSAGERSGALNTASYSADYGGDVFAFPYSVGVPSGKGCNGLIKKGAYLCEEVGDIFSVLGIQYSGGEESLLDSEERAVLNLLKGEGELHSEKIAQLLNKKLFEVLPLLASLEIKGLVIKLAGNRYTVI